jgi:hypothetical protein
VEPDESINASGAPKARTSPGGLGTGAITQEVLLEQIQKYCREWDGAQAAKNTLNQWLSEWVAMPLEYAPRLINSTRTSYDRLKQDCRLDDLVRYMSIEIRDAGRRLPQDAHYGRVAKHQYVGILRSFFNDDVWNQEGRGEWLPLVVWLTDLIRNP